MPAAVLSDIHNVYANVFGVDEKDVLNQIQRCEKVTQGVNGTSIKVPLQSGIAPLQRFFLVSSQAACNSPSFVIYESIFAESAI